MINVKKIALNTLILLIGQIISKFFAFFYTMYVARYLGTEGFGILNFALSLTGITCLFADLGLSTLITKDVSRNKSLAGKYIGNIFAIKLVLSIFTLGLTIVIIHLLEYPPQTTKVVYLITFSNLFYSFSGMFNSLFQAFEKMEYISVGRVLTNILMLCGALIAIYQNYPIIFFASIYFFVNLIILGYCLSLCFLEFFKVKIDFNFSFLKNVIFDFPFWKNVIKESIPFWMTGVFVIIYFSMDIIMLSLMKGDEVVGWYAAAYRLIDTLSIIPSVFMSVMFPFFSKNYLTSNESLEIAFRKSMKYLVLIAIPIGIGTTILADDIIKFIYGNEYVPSVIALRILIWASVLSFINWSPSTLLNSVDKQKALTVFTCIGAILNILMNFLLIPSLSYKGAAIATISSEFLVGLLMMYQIQKTQKLLLPLVNTIIKSSISGVIMGIFILIFSSYSLFTLVPLASIVYFIFLFVIKAFGKDDIELFSQVVKR